MMIILLDLKLEPLKFIKVSKDKKQETLYQFPHATLQQLCNVHPLGFLEACDNFSDLGAVHILWQCHVWVFISML